MFRCKECGSEFDKKPDYCDCGNDTFEEIISEANTKQHTEEKKTEPKEDSELKKNLPSIIFLIICNSRKS